MSWKPNKHLSTFLLIQYVDAGFAKIRSYNNKLKQYSRGEKVKVNEKN